MNIALTLLALAALVLVGTAIARRTGASAPLLLTAVGIALSFVPGIPEIEVGPELILIGILPPLLYAAAIRTSLVDLKANRNVIALLSVGLVIFTAVGVGLLVMWAMNVPFAVGLAVGGIVAPPDAVAATAVARRIGLPRRLVTILEGESLFNDATAIAVVRAAITGIAGSLGVMQVGLAFVQAAVGGVVVGLVMAWILLQVRKRVQDTTSDTALSFMVPWLAYLPAELINASGVLSVVVTGVLLGHRSPFVQTAQARVAAQTNWRTIQYVLENVVFLVIGLQTHAIVTRVSESDLGLGHASLLAAGVLVAVMLLRPLWIFTFGVVFQLVPGSRREGAYFRSASVLSWAGMRGVVTLAGALLLPADTPERDTIVYIALVVTVGTLLVNGLTLPSLARAMDVHGPDPREDALQFANLLQRAVGAGRAALERNDDSSTPPAVIEALQSADQRRTEIAWERLGDNREGEESPNVTYLRLRRDMLAAERDEVLRLRAGGTIDTEVVQEVMQTLDLEESMITGIESRSERIEERMVLTPELQRGDCEHLREATTCVEPTSPDSCLDCVREGLTWVHLRLCLSCGNVGCCDSSPGNHATKHYASSGHPVMRSFEVGEGWRWCYVDELLG